jgi:hypothetical protein
MSGSRVLRALLAALVVLPFAATAVLAHPLGNFTINHHAGIRVEPDRILLDVVIDQAEIPTFQAVMDLDEDGDGEFSDDELLAAKTSGCTSVGDALSLMVNGSAAPLRVVEAGITFPPGNGGLSTMRLVCTLESPLAAPIASPTTIAFEDRFEPSRIGWREMTAITSGLTLAGSDLPDAQFDVPYHAQLVTGGTPPYTMTLVKGSLPAGLDFYDTGKIAGVPTGKSGKRKITVQVTDQDSTSLSGQFDLTVFKGLVISTKALKKGKVGKPYKMTLKAAGGSAKLAPRVWSLTAGSLPDGLVMDSAGVISGTPTAATAPAGVTLTVQVTDSLGGEDHKAFTLIVN